MLEYFGGYDYIVSSYLVWFFKDEVEEIIKDMIELILEEKKVDIKKLCEDVVIMMLCKKFIKVNYYL